MIRIVPIEQVAPSNKPCLPLIRKMVAVLKKQGQIEALQVRIARPLINNLPERGTYTTFDRDPWGDEIIYAARILGWPTLLVGVTDKYEE